MGYEHLLLLVPLIVTGCFAGGSGNLTQGVSHLSFDAAEISAASLNNPLAVAANGSRLSQLESSCGPSVNPVESNGVISAAAASPGPFDIRNMDYTGSLSDSNFIVEDGRLKLNVGIVAA